MGNRHGIPAAESRESGPAARAHVEPNRGPADRHCRVAADDSCDAGASLPPQSVRGIGPGQGPVTAMSPTLNGHGGTKPDPLASLAARLTDPQDRETYAAL